jgi:hypothetical protein
VRSLNTSLIAAPLLGLLTLTPLTLIPNEALADIPAGVGADIAADIVSDIGAIKDQLKIVGDGKGHFIAVVPFGAGKDLYYGDGKTFHAQRVFSSGSSGTESFSLSFWEPRVSAPYKASFDLRDGKYRVQCDERITELPALSEDEGRALIAGARFLTARWKHRAHALARDDRGTYYYVDRVREPEDSKIFRLYVGPKGSMKPLKMLNIVSDSQGEIFSTAGGELRLVLDKKETVWIKRNKRTTLSNLPVDDNHVLIYTDLGVYAGQRLGTPCDDL